jgi:hypothetical protein
LHAARRTEEAVLPQEESANYIRPACNDGNTSFPPLAGVDHDAGHRGPVVCAIAAPIRVPDGVFHASLAHLESCNLPAPVAQAIFKKQNFWPAEKENDAARRVG